MASNNVETLRAAHESWNRRDFAGVVRNSAESLAYTDNARSLNLNGPDKFREWTEAWAKAFSALAAPHEERAAREPPTAAARRHPAGEGERQGKSGGALRGPGHECRDHEHLALGKVQRAGGVVDDHEAERDQRVDAARREPADDDVDQGRTTHDRILLGPLGPVKATAARAAPPA